MTGTARPLDGCRVLDFSWVWSGPMVAAALSELGAEVIKVENGKRLDNARLRGRPTIDGVQPEGPSIELNPYFHQTNHGKLSVTLNLKEPRAIKIVETLVRKSDVLVENLSVGALGRLGLGYEQLSVVNPALVYLSMSAAGQTGPSRSMRAYAPIMSSITGLERLIAYPGEPPLGMMNFGYGDPNAGIHGLLALLSAVFYQRQTGEGQHIDMSQVEAILSVIPEPILEFLWAGNEPEARGNRHLEMAPHGIYRTAGADRWIALAVPDDAAWRRLCKVMDDPIWATSGKFDTIAKRLAEVVELEERMMSWTATQERDDLVERLQVEKLAAAPVLSVREQWVHPQFQARGLRQKVIHELLGEELIYPLPWQVDGSALPLETSAPLLGAHNKYVLGEVAGLSEDEIQDLAQAGIVE